MTTKNCAKLCIAILIVAFLFSSCQKQEEAEEIFRPVRYIQVFSAGGSRVRTFAGVAEPGTESRLSFKVPGTVKRIPVRVGDRVRAGQIIAELDQYDYQLRVQQADASLAQAKAQARNANSNYNRVRTLYENNGASRQDLESARTAYESATAAVQALEKQLEQARLQMSYTRIAASMNGAIAAVHVETSENVQAGQPIILLTSGSQLEVKVSIPEILISQVEEKKEAAVRFDAIPDEEFQAIVTEVGVKSMTMATTFPVTLSLEKTDSDIRAGMAAAVTFLFESKDERIRFNVPSEAVGEDREGRFVFLVELIPDEEGYGIVWRKSVAVGELTSEGLEIFEGLTDGDFVVTAGISHIVDGQKVKL